jgi:predicted ATPase
MIRSLSIRNYKSVSELDIDLGRVNVFIGANGCGKSNILEAIAFAAAAATDRLDNEFLASRGVRVPEHPRMMRSAFAKEAMNINVEVSIKYESQAGPFSLGFTLVNDNRSPYSKWSDGFQVQYPNDWAKTELRDVNDQSPEERSVLIKRLAAASARVDAFLIYSPEQSALRTFSVDSQIQPLGIRGEGLFRLLTVMASQPGHEDLQAINREMCLLDWFDSFDIPEQTPFGERSLKIRDRYLYDSLEYITQRIANEGFLYVLFYFALLISSDTPKFFAVDNVDVSLNPRLCQELIRRMNKLAVEHDKQMILTTHSPSVLDGIDLRDDEQRLFVVFRNTDGRTRCRRIEYKEPLPDQEPVRLSEAFLRGYLGGLHRQARQQGQELRRYPQPTTAGNRLHDRPQERSRL